MIRKIAPTLAAIAALALSLALLISPPPVTPTASAAPAPLASQSVPDPVAHRQQVMSVARPASVTQAPAPRAKAPVHKTVHKKPKNKGKCGASCQWHKTDAVWAKYPAWVEKFALCVSHHESWSPHMWTAENPISTASGGFQWIDGSWWVNMKRAGVRGVRHAANNSPVKQAEVTAWVITHGGRWNWKGTHCGYGT